MAGKGVTRFVARVQAKDEDAKVELSITSETTVGELLRYWDWRNDTAAGFRIDISSPSTSNRGGRAFAGTQPSEEIRPTKKSKREADTSGIARSSRSTNAAAGSSGSQPIKRRIDMGQDEEEEEEEEIEEIEVKPAITDSGAIKAVKLDPKAGYPISVSFSNGQEIPMHILGTTPISDIAASACKALKIPREPVHFQHDIHRYTPPQPDYPNMYSTYVAKTKKWAMLGIKPMTAEQWRLRAGSVVIATIRKDAVPKIGSLARSMAHPAGGKNASSGAKWTIYVRTLTSKTLSVNTGPTMRMGDIGREACRQEKVPFDQARFIHAGREVMNYNSYSRAEATYEKAGKSAAEIAVLLIRDREALDKTAEQWGLMDGSTLYMVLCLCGC